MSTEPSADSLPAPSQELPAGLGRVWAEPALDLDEGALSERAVTLGGSRDVRVLARSNRIALTHDRVQRHLGVEEDVDVLDIPLRGVAHAHPDCRFRWVRIALDLTPTTGAVIQDLTPSQEIAKDPVKITTTYRGGLKFHHAAVPLDVELSGERSSEHDVYFPSITVSGVSLPQAIWDFKAVAEAPLHVDRDLRLLVAVPSGTNEITARLTMRAQITTVGVAGMIPLIGRRQGVLALTDTFGG